ncbi:hypothetical protein GGR92_005122 [Spirosoma lacussanchae]|uniref:hypothetical protein n=1 Tax=Spirosoma lacussanchae TaxID=1884249 RepID=UPI001109BAF2|nr:hypothetical protein [Spirosoma lacussanchae]
MKDSETLKDALTRTGDAKYVKHLTPDAQQLTKAQLTDFMNSKTDQDFKPETISSLRKFAKMRMKDGKSIFPYEKMEKLKHNESDDHMGGGTW